jgi:hypothetical protein
VWISPIAVDVPVPVTIAFACPTVTVVPYNQTRFKETNRE